MQSLLEAGTSVIADIFDENGFEPPVLSNDLFSIPQGVRFVGRAFTVVGRSVDYSGGGDRKKLEAIDAMGPGDVAVWAGSDMQGVCCFGDLLAEAMKTRGCAGAVVDGGVRDLAYLRELRLPIMAKYRTPAQAIGRWKVDAYQVPVRLRGALTDWVTVNPGDLVVADDDGVVVVDAASIAPVAAAAESRSATESVVREDIRLGMPLLEAFDRYGHL